MRRLCCLLLALALLFAGRAPWPDPTAPSVRVDVGQAGTGSSTPAHPDVAPPAIVASVQSWSVASGDALCPVQPVTLARDAGPSERPASGRSSHTVPPQARRFPLLI